MDDAAVRRVRDRGGDECAVPLPPRPRADGAVRRVRHAGVDGGRLRLAPCPRRGRPGGRRRRVARGHGDPVRRDPARRGLYVDDDQLVCGDRACDVSRRRRGTAGATREAPRDDPDGHPQGVHRPEGVHLPARAVDAPRHGHGRVLREGDATLAPDLRIGLPHPRGRVDRRARSSPSPSRTGSPMSSGRSSGASTSTPSPRGSRSSSTRTSTSSRRSRNTVRRAGSGRARCGTPTARETSARC